MKKILAGLSILSFMVTSTAFATYDENYSNTSSSVKAIYLKNSSENSRKIFWEVDGYSSQGFKVVWSKNENPEYPTRSGDKYHYFDNPSYKYDTIDEAFAGEGIYYVRVCEYLGGKCGIYSNQIKVELSSSGYEKPTPVLYNSDSENESINESEKIPSGYEKIPNLESIGLYTKIKKIGDSLYGVKLESLIPTNYQKIPNIESIKYYKNIKRIGNALYGIKISDEKKQQIQKKINSLNEQLKKLQEQIQKLTEEMNSL